jgi:hypothetical protein
MSDNPAGAEELSIEEEVEETCRLIRWETISPLTWFFPVSNACVSCVLITGGHPEIMAAYCPKVIDRLSEQAGPVEPADSSQG